MVLHRDNPGASFQGIGEGERLFALLVFLPHPAFHAGGIGGADVHDLPHGGLFGQAEEEGTEPPPVKPFGRQVDAVCLLERRHDVVGVVGIIEGDFSRTGAAGTARLPVGRAAGIEPEHGGKGVFYLRGRDRLPVEPAEGLEQKPCRVLLRLLPEILV